MPTQKKSPALFYGVAMAALLANGAGAVVLGQSTQKSFTALGLYLISLALTGMWAYIANKNDERFGPFLFLMTLTAGPFGAGIVFMAALVHERCAPGAVSPAEWIESLFERAPDRETDRLFERITFGLDDSQAADNVEPFADILLGGTVMQKQMAIAKIARYFRPAFAPLLLQSARDPNAAVRVQAATALAKIERDFMNRYMKLENDLKDVADSNPAKLPLAELYDEYAHAGLLDEGSRHSLRLKAIGIYEACLTERDDPTCRIRLARLYLRQDEAEKARDLLSPLVLQETPPRGALLWYMEALFRLKNFKTLREFSDRYAPQLEKLTTDSDSEIQNLVNIWQAAA